ncbi:MAG: hypothetical protein WCD73_17805, partial [Pseudolabrys sp.]
MVECSALGKATARQVGVERWSRQHILPAMKRRTFLEVISAGAAAVLTGGLPKLLEAASTNK